MPLAQGMLLCQWQGTACQHASTHTVFYMAAQLARAYQQRLQGGMGGTCWPCQNVLTGTTITEHMKRKKKSRNRCNFEHTVKDSSS